MDIALKIQRETKTLMREDQMISIFRHRTRLMEEAEPPASYGALYGAGGALFEPARQCAESQWQAVPGIRLLACCALSAGMFEITPTTRPCIFCGSVSIIL